MEPGTKSKMVLQKTGHKQQAIVSLGGSDNPNAAFAAVLDDAGNVVATEQIAPLTDEIKNRNDKFDSPPDWLLSELSHDLIHDHWEQCSKKETSQPKEPGQCFDYQPRIGIMTQPHDKGSAFNADQYILEVNYDFIRWAGSVPVVIPYDIAEEDLAQLLPQINGVLFTGGALTLIDQDNGQHPYYQTAKRIFNHVLYSKDVLDEHFPLLAICQGLEVISILLNEDDHDTLSHIEIYGQDRPVHWEDENPQRSKMFHTFPEELIQAMGRDKVAIHAHTYAISLDTYEKSAGLKRLMNVLQTDSLTIDGKKVEFIDAMEAKEYPVFSTMYHPEYQFTTHVGPKSGVKSANRKNVTEIAFRLSLLLNREARKNPNQIDEEMEYSVREIDPKHDFLGVYPVKADYMQYAFGWSF